MRIKFLLITTICIINLQSIVFANTCILDNLNNDFLYDRLVNSSIGCDDHTLCTNKSKELTNDVYNPPTERVVFCVPDEKGTGQFMICPKTLTLTDKTTRSQTQNPPWYDLVRNISLKSYDPSTNANLYKTCLSLDNYLTSSDTLNNDIEVPIDTPTLGFCDLTNNNNFSCDYQLCNIDKVYNIVPVNPATELDDKVIFCGGDASNGEKWICESYVVGDNFKKYITTPRNDPYAFFNLHKNDTTRCQNLKSLVQGNSTLVSNFIVSPVPIVNPIQIIRNFSQVMFGLALFLFSLLLILNGIRIVRSSSKPEEAKKAKEGLFNAFAGILFVILSLGFIINIIQSL